MSGLHHAPRAIARTKYRGCRRRRRRGSAQGVLQLVDELASDGAGSQADRAAGDDRALPRPACSCTRRWPPHAASPIARIRYRGCRPRRRRGPAQGVLHLVDELASGGAGSQADRAAGGDRVSPYPACSCTRHCRSRVPGAAVVGRAGDVDPPRASCSWSTSWPAAAPAARPAAQPAVITHHPARPAAARGAGHRTHPGRSRAPGAAGDAGGADVDPPRASCSWSTSWPAAAPAARPAALPAMIERYPARPAAARGAGHRTRLGRSRVPGAAVVGRAGAVDPSRAPSDRSTGWPSQRQVGPIAANGRENEKSPDEPGICRVSV